MKKIKGGKQFSKKFGMACGDFGIVDNNGTDKFLIPVDLDYPHQTLLFWMHYKTTKMPKHFKITAVHLFSTQEINQKTDIYFESECQKIGADYIKRKVEQPSNRHEYYRMLLDIATEYNCNKIAIPDSIDFLNALLLTNMSHGTFNGASIVQPMKLNDDSPEVFLTRPLCYATDVDIENFGKECKFINDPSGITISEEPFIAIARKGLNEFYTESTNVRLNFFKSQFTIQKKYVGIGEDIVLGSTDADIDKIDIDK